MKSVLILLFFNFIFSISGQLNPNDLSEYEILNVSRQKYNLKELIKSRDIKLIYFFNDKSCKLCFANQFSQLKKLNNNKQFIIVTNFKNLNSLKSYSTNYGLKKAFLISPVSFNTSFYYNVTNKKIFIPGINKGLNQFIYQALKDQE